MILYKYYGYDSGLKALKSGQLGFRKPKNFNDPFELSFLSNSNGPDSKAVSLRRVLEDLRDTVVVLSLTRTPDNPLMWAHYCDDHSGFVVGYDVSDDFLSSQEYNLIPVTAGDVVYTNTKSAHILNPEVMERIQGVYLSGFGDLSQLREPETNALARKIFLTKHASWVYEEEVRVVKMTQSLFDETEKVCENPRRTYTWSTRDIAPDIAVEEIPGLAIFNFQVPIKEVYLGLRNKLVEAQNDFTRIEGADYFRFLMDDKSWNLKAEKLPET